MKKLFSIIFSQEPGTLGSVPLKGPSSVL